ncbi:MAG: hypothetical protein LAN36_11230 [Acidobacteriia bacterium]|nr:hypothetical protein [Terriglobia bacterium]
MKAYWLMIGLLVAAPSLSAKTRVTEQQVVTYAKAIDVAKLDPTLPSQRLDKWLQSGPAHLDTVTWELSDCDLKPLDSPEYVAPLCAKVRIKRGNVGGWIIITVGTFRDGISGAPRVNYVFAGPPDVFTRTPAVPVPTSEKLSDLPRLLDEAP